jgi:hypothetical protein
VLVRSRAGRRVELMVDIRRQPITKMHQPASHASRSMSLPR